MAGQAPMALIVSHVGWRKGLFYAGLLGILIAMFFYLFVRNKNNSSKSSKSKQKGSQTLRLSNFTQLLKCKHNWLLMLYSGLAFSPVAVFGSLWGNPFLQEAFHLTRPEAATLTSMMFFGLAVGGPVFGFVSDKLGMRYGIMYFGVLLSLVSLLAALYAPNMPIWLEGTSLFLFGFGTGAFMLGFALGKEMNHIALAATVVALINTGDALFGAFSEPLVGKILDICWNGKVVSGVHYFTVHNFHIALLLLPIYLVCALICLRGLKRDIHMGAESLLITK